MKIAIPKNLTEIKHHLHDPLFRNSYFLMANRITGADAGMGDDADEGSLSGAFAVILMFHASNNMIM